MVSAEQICFKCHNNLLLVRNNQIILVVFQNTVTGYRSKVTTGTRVYFSSFTAAECSEVYNLFLGIHRFI